jgi:hypothetical protein
MADLLKFSSVRDVEAVPTEVTQAKGIYTHAVPEEEIIGSGQRASQQLSVSWDLTKKWPVSVWDVISELQPPPNPDIFLGGTPRQSSLYSELRSAAISNDVPSVIRICTDYVKRSKGSIRLPQPVNDPVLLPEDTSVLSIRDLSATTQYLLNYLAGAHGELRTEALQNIFGRIQDLPAYVTSSVRIELQRTSDTLLAFHMLKVPSTKALPLTTILRTLLTAFFWGKHQLDTQQSVARKQTPPKPPLRLLLKFWKQPIFLPEWAFKVDPCDAPRTATSWLQDSQLITQTAAVAKYRASQSSTQPPVAPATTSTVIARTEWPNQDIKRKTEGTSPSETPKTDDPCSCCDDYKPTCMPQNPCCADINYYVTDYFVLRDETYCYKAGDLAYIEVVAAGEERIRRHAIKKTTETSTEDETTTDTKEERDRQMTDRSSLQSEINNEINRSLDVTASVSGTGYKLDTSVALSRSDSEKVARETAIEVVDKAVSSIQTKVRKLRKERSLLEVDEINRYKFVNLTDTPRVTKYFWVTQQKKAQVYSLGKKVTVELLVPSPALLYEHLESKRQQLGMQRPVFPTVKVEGRSTDVTVETITETNYQSLSLLVGIYNPPVAPLSSISEVKTAQGNFDGNGHHWHVISTITPPTGYRLFRWDSQLLRTSMSDGPTTADAGAVVFYLKSEGAVCKKDLVAVSHIWEAEDGQAGPYELIGIAYGKGDYALRHTFEYKVTAAAVRQWKESIYGAIVTAYQEKLAAYNEALEEHKRKTESKIKGRHPFYNREIERAELKRAAIYMMCQNFEKNGRINLKSEPCGYPEIDREKAEKMGWDWYFWDRCIDWGLMNYVFYDYFWNPMCKWPEKFDPDEPDALFKAFRRAGYARIQVPIAEGMEHDFEYYAQTGMKWGEGGIPPLNPGDKRWRSVVEEIKHQRGCYQSDRPGYVDLTNPPQTPSTIVTIKDCDVYWDSDTDAIDYLAIENDIDREIFIDCVPYRIVAIAPHPQSPSYDSQPGHSMWWNFELERLYEVSDKPNRATKPKYAVGAKYVGAPFIFELPTELIWAGTTEDEQHKNCLPCYPLAKC